MKFSNKAGSIIPQTITSFLIEKKDYLSELDSFVGDGDHGINLAKGMEIAQNSISEADDMSQGFKKIASALENEIGGSLGPLFGFFFEALADESANSAEIDGGILDQMFTEAKDQVSMLTEAQVGDKTIVDVLYPSVDAYHESWQLTNDLKQAIESMSKEANQGLENTKNMLAKYGRGHRLGEKVLGHVDSGATTMNFIIQIITDQVVKLIDGGTYE